MTHEEKVELIKGLITLMVSVNDEKDRCLDHNETMLAALKELTQRAKSFEFDYQRTTQEDKPTTKCKPFVYHTHVDGTSQREFLTQLMQLDIPDNKIQILLDNKWGMK